MTPKPVNQQNPSSSSSSEFVTVFTEISHFNPKPLLQGQAFSTTIEIFLFRDPIIDLDPHRHHYLRSPLIHADPKPKINTQLRYTDPKSKINTQIQISNPRPNQPKSTPSSVTP
ncbi:hypothetical protein CMV_001580 [Castanea mollissima]|uniref:Uncharacterized protein n=1 Tax=Castanea mollissima TaxID=60419 RepID=A0A8J4S2D5_9ROSI|nr:hypothetical protein CMV_001580 [Castanea mollissima]